MERITITSTNMASVGYDPELCTLEVEFVKGGIWQYHGVPIDVYDSLMAAPSKGQYFNETIKKGGYPPSKIG